MNPTCRPRASLVPFLALLVSIAWSGSARADTGAPPGSWVSLGPTKIINGESPASRGDVTGRVATIAVDFSDPNLIFVGARGSGVWRTIDGGARWEPVTDKLPTQTVLALATAPSLPNRVYLNTPIGTFRSEDAGSTWNEVSTGDLFGRGWDGGAMLVDPFDPDLVFLTSCISPGLTTPSIRRSSDGGVTWETVLSMGCATGLVRDPADPNRFLAAISNDGTGSGSGTGLYETLDGGTTWNPRPGCNGAQFPPPAPKTLVKIAQSGEVRFVSYHWGTDQYQVFRSDGTTCGKGATRDFVWVPAWTAPPGVAEGELKSAIHVNPRDPNLVAATGKRLFVSTDGGFNFAPIDPQMHVDHHAWVNHPFDPSIVFAGTDGGLYRSTKDGLSGTWSFLGEGIVNAELFDLSDAATSPHLLFAGSQDNGAFEYPGAGTIWRLKVGGDAEMVEIDPTDDNVRYLATQAQSSLFKTTDGFATPPTAIGAGLPTDWQVCPFPWSGEYPADPQSQFLISPANPSVLLLSCGSFWRGLPWSSVFTPMPADASTVAVDASNYIYWLGTASGGIWASASGVNWRLLAEGHSPSVALQVDPTDPRVVFAAFRPSGQAEERVYRLVRLDNPPTAALAVDITNDLPVGVRLKSLAIDRLQPQTIYAGTDFGVYRGHSSDGGATWNWTSYKNGMPEAVDVRALEVHPTTGVMRAGTFGRGVYEVDTDFPIGSLIAAEGRVTALRIQDVGQGFGPPGDVVDADVIVQLDSTPGFSYGFQLRLDGDATARRGMLDRLRDALRRDTRVRLEYVRTGFRNGMLRRVWNLP